MAEFRYEALLLPNCKAIQGLIEAADEAEALELLAQRQDLTRVKLIVSSVMPIESVRPVSRSIDAQTEVSQRPETPSVTTFQRQDVTGCKLNLKEKISFFRNTSKMLKAGIPIIDVLEKQGTRSVRPGFQKILSQIRQDIMGGLTLEAAIAKHAKSFDTFSIRMTGIGERAGALDHVMERIAAMYHQQLILQGKLLSAAVMPLFTLATLGILGGIILGGLLPFFIGIADGMDLHNPVLDTLRIISRFWYFILFGIIAGMAGIGYFFFRTEFGQAVIAELLVILPVFRHPVIQSQIAQFLRALHLTYNAGIPISEGVGLAVDSLTNHVMQEKFSVLRELIEDGMSLEEALPQSDSMLSDDIQDALITGEETGMLDAALSNAITETETEVQILLDRLPEQLKPVAMLMLLLILGIILTLFYGGLFSMMSSAFTIRA